MILSRSLASPNAPLRLKSAALELARAAARLVGKRILAPMLTTALALLGNRAEAAPTSSVDMRHLRVTDAGVFAPIGPGGAEVRTTIDPELQRAAERILSRAGAHEAAIVASDPRTGRVLAWASRGSKDFVAEAFAPSASLFKVVTAAALLDGHVSPAARECYEGGEHAIEPADLARHGSTCTTFGEALGHSVNLVFARLAQKHLTADRLRAYAASMGFSGAVPIDVPVGKSMITIPEDPFGMARASAGFWNGQLSPLGALFAMSTVANEGERIKLSVVDHGGATRTSVGQAMAPASARTLARMLEVTTRRGTAAKAFHAPDGHAYLPGIPVAAKTGTLVGGGRARMYSWFAGFAPSTKPEIAIAVMLGNDLHWHTKANIVGRELLESYFGGSSGGPPGARASKRAPGRSRR